MSKYNLHLPKTAFSLKRREGSESQFVDLVSSHPSSEGFNFLLHDGPPYANGNLHVGHFLNKVVKDAVNRHQERFRGKTVSFRPGWDCHGLPVEVKVEEQYTKAGKSKEDDVVQFRKDCRAYADSWVEVQKEQFKSFGVRAEWDQCYKTQDYSYEAETLKNLYSLQEKGMLEYRFRPVHWSPVEKTTLAEAELEKVDMPMDSLFVEFKVEGEPYGLMVWTTTPWTLPGNKAVAYNSNASYVMFETPEGRKLVSTLNYFQCFSHARNLKFLEPFDVLNLTGKVVFGPFGTKSPLLQADDVVNEMAGSGFLHVVPGHGFEDFKLGVKYGLDLDGLVDDNAMMEVNGQKVHVYKANDAVREFLGSLSNLEYWYEQYRTHQRDVSWRSKKPVVVKTAKNWFFNFESFKEELINALDNVYWDTTTRANRLKSMLGDRTEWCLSRQRLWGVPMALFLHKSTGQMLVDEKVNQSMVELFKEKGSDVWYEHDADFFLPEKYHGQYDKVMDVLDVWFDSGSSLKAVYPDVDQADLYFEGTDQHRGWFQSSALLHYALYGKLPYVSVYTHGFVLEHRQKMSKSAGTKSSLSDLLNKYGTDTFRLWLLNGDPMCDMNFDETLLEQSKNNYDKLRNTVRFCLSNLDDGQDYSDATLRNVDLYVLSKLKEMMVKQQKYNLPDPRPFLQYCRWVSEFYFTQVKDVLYCDSKNSPDRQAVLSTLQKILNTLLYAMESCTPFLVAEATQYGATPSNCVENLNTDNLGYWEYVEDEREEALKYFEEFRKETGLQMDQVTVCFESLLPVDWKTLLGCAEYRNETVEGRSVYFEQYNGEKCLRCRTYHAKVNSDDLCQRCEEVENECSSSL